MTALHGHFSRAELADVAEKLLADRRRGDPEAVSRKIFTAEKAAQRERIAGIIAATLRAIAEHREPGDAEQRWVATDGAEGAVWHDVRADLAAIADAARCSALQPGTPPAAEQYALKLLAIAELFEPVVPDGISPLILTLSFVERALRRGREEAQATATAPPALTRARTARIASGLFG